MTLHRPRGRANASRDPWLDNSKMLLVTLVVVRHSWMLLPDDAPSTRIGWFLYDWHMPAFVLVTGYLSRSFCYRGDKLWSLVRTVVVPYLVFEGAMVLFGTYVGGGVTSDVLQSPSWPLWFLSSLVFWRLSVPLFRRMAPEAAIAVAIGVSLVAGSFAVTFLDLARTLGLLPFFVIGLVATPERLALLRGTAPKVLAVLTLAGLWVLSGHLGAWVSTDWLYYKDSYAELGADLGPALVIRLAMIATGLAGSLAFLALVPRAGGWFTRMGQWTLVVYLMHPFVVKAAEVSAFPGWAAAHPWVGFGVASSVAVALALALAAPPVARRLDLLTDPLCRPERDLARAVRLAAAASEPVREPHHIHAERALASR